MVSLLADLLSAVNVFLAGLITVIELREMQIRHRFKLKTRWLQSAQIVIGAYWMGLYLWVLLSPVQYDPVWFGQVFVRPAFTVTLAVMAAAAMRRRW